VYGEWSFRDAPSWLRERYFTKGKDGRFEIHPRIRKMVMFSYLNFVDDVYPSLSNNTSAMDVILCRNVRCISPRSGQNRSPVIFTARCLMEDGDRQSN